MTSVTSGEPLGQPPAAAERVLRVGVDVQANERVTTKADDRAHLVFLDGSSLSVGPNSALVIDKFVYDPDGKLGDMTISASRGALRFVGGAISKKSEVQIKTPSATIGIRGGIATVAINDTGGTTANFLYGQSMTVTGQGVTQVATRNGSQIDVTPSGRPSPPSIIPRGGFAGGHIFERSRPPGQPPGQPGVQPPPPGPQRQPAPRQPQAQQQPAPQQQPASRPPAQSQQPSDAEMAKLSSVNSASANPPPGPQGPKMGPRRMAGPPIAALRVPPKVEPRRPPPRPPIKNH